MSEEKQPGSNLELDTIEAHAKVLSVDDLTPGGEAQPDGATKQPEPEPQPQPEQQPDEAFKATADITVTVLKDYFKKKYGDNPRIDEALAVWDSPLFAATFIPVLKKYNISIMNLPVELVLAGMLWKMSSDMVSILKQGQADAATS